MIIDSRYKIIEEVGSGIWATVYQVQDTRSKKTYALKHFHKLTNAEFYQKFSAENMHQITKLRHPNLLHVHDFGNFDDNIYCLSEYFNGKILSKFKFSKSNIDLLYEIIVQTCYGIGALHNQNILHKDLKPTNIVYQIQNNHPVVKVLDYGFYKIGSEKKSQKINQNLPYIAPEIYTDKLVNEASDFYSLGMILYKVTTGTLPYSTEQLANVVSGDHFDIFPKFPREINPEIPEKLENLILKLIEKNPEDRFQNIDEIIVFINETQSQKFSLSSKWSIVNRIRFSDYIVREDYSHKLLDYLPIVSAGNGKIISLSAGKGLGKNNVLTLFKYHILTNEYYVFDYECSQTKKDPFFALIKEFYAAAENNKKIESDLSKISEKLREYLFNSEVVATKKKQDKRALDLDYKSASNFIYHLSTEKPIVFIIRSAEHLGKEVFDFINYISRGILNRPILIILSINDPRQLEGLVHAVKIKISDLSFIETKKYVTKLLNVIPSEVFLQKLWERSNGNPRFIENILIDLTLNKKIWKKNKFVFDFKFNNYILPKKLLNDIYLRMAHLHKKNYQFFQYLAWINTDSSKDLIKHILHINNEELFNLLQDGINNELFKKIGKYYRITFSEAKLRLIRELTTNQKKEISQKIVQYFDEHKITKIHFCENIISHAKYLKNYEAVRKYNTLLAQIHFSKNNFHQAFLEMCNVIELDISEKLSVSESELKMDMSIFIDYSEWITDDQIPEKIKKMILKMPEISEKYLLMGVYYNAMNKYNKAQKMLQKADDLVFTGKAKISVLLQLCSVYFYKNDFYKLGNCIQKLSQFKLLVEENLEYIAFKCLHLGFNGKLNESTIILEDFIANIKSQNNAKYLSRVASLHNVLAILYNKKKQLDNAEKHFLFAQKIWMSLNHKKKMGVIYNNIGDVALAKGNTIKAFENFKKALTICEQTNNKRVKVQALLNHGQAYIKLGCFFDAENYLNDALKLSNKLEATPFHKSIIINLAIAKSKINNFAYYFDFIKKHTPKLLHGIIDDVTPLTKTFFYYLYEIGDFLMIKQMLENYAHLFFEKKEQEFYYQMLGFLKLELNDNDAESTIQTAFQYSVENKSDYAKVINSIRLLQCSFYEKDFRKSYKICQNIDAICKKNNFAYWQLVLDLKKIKVQLLDEKISIRYLVRKLHKILDFTISNKLFILELEAESLLIQIYSFLKLSDVAEKYFKMYKTTIKRITVGIPLKDKKLYFARMGYKISQVSDFKLMTIVTRKVQDSNVWQEDLFDILKLHNLKRMKFFIDRTIQSLFAPNFYTIILNEIDSATNHFLKFNLQKKLSARNKKYIEKCLEINKPITRKIEKINVLFIPLKIKSAEIGTLIIADDGEFPFQDYEIAIAKIIRLHLTSILMRITEFENLNKDMTLMTKLVTVLRKFFSIFTIDKLEQEIVSFLLDFTKGSRGFLIIKDASENYKFKVTQDASNNLMGDYKYINKTVLSDVQRLGEPIFIAKNDVNEMNYTTNLQQDNLAIYCAPITIDKNIYGYIYIDNLNSNNVLEINQNFMKLILIQISIAFKNAFQYEELNNKNREINSLDSLKQEFINIASHELRTPLTMLQSNLRTLSKNKQIAEKTIFEMENGLTKLNAITDDLINFNKFQMLNSIDKNVINVSELLMILKSKMEKISNQRNMQFILEIDSQIGNIFVNKNALELVLKNIILNAIRFTKDFGTIILGVRYSAFQQEEIAGEESVVFYIQDNGIGIPQNEVSNVFQKFYELSDIISHRSGSIEFRSSGLGVGLSTAKQIVNLHDGKIWINSKKNEGTIVFVALPKL